MRRGRVAFGILLLAAVFSSYAVAQTADPQGLPLEGKVLSITDGDTVILRGGERVRYLNIDTPEIGQPFAAEAKEFNRQLVRFKDVRLETDAKERDTYGRLLAYVYVETDDGWVMVNLELVRAGLAKLLFIPPNGKYRAAFEDALRDAMIHRRGMWGTMQGVLSVPDLEARLVDYTNEVVTVSFVVAEVDPDRAGGLRLVAADSAYGFRVEIAADCGEVEFAPGDELLTTGVLGCTLKGPFIAVESLDQIVRLEPETVDDS
jgi:endonuclease YncB( thermonuclease family)